MVDIVFTNIYSSPEIYAPTPATQCIPNWYRTLESYKGGAKILDEDKKAPSTAKRCMPIFDAITSGYLIYSHVDVYVSQKFDDNGKLHPYYDWKTSPGIEFHPTWQLPEHPNNKGHELGYPKWLNSWGIKTPKGYSCLFIQPMHRDSIFTIFPGVVDTDSYTSPVNFPFVLNDIGFEGFIPAGTPIAQVIPFKRESWKMSLGNEKEIQQHSNVGKSIASKYFDAYKTLYRSIKEYK